MTKLGPVTYETPTSPQATLVQSIMPYFSGWDSTLPSGLLEDRPRGIKHAPPCARIQEFFNDSRLHADGRGCGPTTELSQFDFDQSRAGASRC
jgi:hypothetical protein